MTIREEAGPAYDVHSFQTGLTHHRGMVQVDMAVDPGDVRAASAAVLAELARLRDERVPDAAGAEPEVRARPTRVASIVMTRSCSASWVPRKEAMARDSSRRSSSRPRA